MIQIGGPLLAVLSLALVVLAASTTPLRRDLAASSGRSQPAPPVAPLFSPTTVATGASPSTLGPLSAPALALVPAPPVFNAPLPFWQPQPRLEELQMAQLEMLRYQVRSANAAMRSLEQARPQAAPGAWQGRLHWAATQSDN